MYSSPPQQQQPMPGYQHYQPPPQPITMPATDSSPASNASNLAIGQPDRARGDQMAYGPGAGQAQQAAMGVGANAGDFELFGPAAATNPAAPAPPSSGASPAQTATTVPPRQRTQHSSRHSAAAAAAPKKLHGHYAIPIPSSGSSSESSLGGADGDYPPVPELVADDADAPSPVSFSPPSPKYAVAPVRPGLLPHPTGAAGSKSSYRSHRGGSSSYRSERASSVPAPEPPRPMRRKTQESRDWPSFYSSGSSSSSASSAGGGAGTGGGGFGGFGGSYLQTPGLGDSKPLLIDEPMSFVTPTASSASAANPFDVSSFALSPAAQYTPYLNYSASPPYPDHPLLPSEQTDLLDRVRRDLLDVDLSSIKGPLRALALSSGGSEPGSWDRETTPTPGLYGAAVAGGGSPSMQPSPWQYPLAATTTPRSGAGAGGTGAAGAGAAAAAQHLLRSPAAGSASDNLSTATVSPQEAFLDYDEVDSRLHPRENGGAAGAGAGAANGGSLFASLPAASEAVRSATGSPGLPMYAAGFGDGGAAPGAGGGAAAAVDGGAPTSSLGQSTAGGRMSLSPPQPNSSTIGSPAGLVAAPTSPNLRPTSPRSAAAGHGHHGHGHGHGHGHHRRGPHPFSVPQNAVTWAEKRSRSGHRVLGSVLVGGDAADDDGDFGPESAGVEEDEDEEEDEEADGEPAAGIDAGPEGRAGAAPEPKAEQEPAVPVTRPGFAAPRPALSSSSGSASQLPGSLRTEDDPPTAKTAEDIKPFLVGKTPLPPTTTSFNPLLPLEAVSNSVVRGGFPGFAPPPPPVVSAPAFGGKTPDFARPRAGGGGFGFTPGVDTPPTAAAGTEGSGTATPRRAAAANALAGLTGPSTLYDGSLPPSDLSSSLAAMAAGSGVAGAPTDTANVAQPPRRPQRNRKRSRIAMSADGSADEEEEMPLAVQTARPGFAAPPKPKTTGTGRASSSAATPAPASSAPPISVSADEYMSGVAGGSIGGTSSATTPEGDAESDASYRSSGSSFGASTPANRRGGGGGRKSDAGPPNKRRRRVPGSVGGGDGAASSGAGASGGSGSIVCNHVNSDGSVCGVIFRRPYDLARHKETIHGEGLKGEKVKAKEWRCAECGGTFSRKDALLRHGRIRGHATG